MGADHGTDAAHHDPNLAHHFRDMQQQVRAGKLGMWAFLATEVLLFAGLFCAYTVYRAMHPEVFDHASQFLDVKLGAVNTVILLASSLTAALAVRAAQLGNRKHLIICLVLTIAGAFGFLGIKYFEYQHKFHERLLWGLDFDPRHEAPPPPPELAAAPVPAGIVDAPVLYDPIAPGRELLEQGSIVPRPPTDVREQDLLAVPAYPPGYDPAAIRNVHVFFGIYFVMTGLHGLHVVIGMIVLGWILWRAVRGDFDAGYYLPVDLAALYWHLVDLIWIFLFPLLYLIE